MGKTIKAKNLVIGEGVPKICVPLVGHTQEALEREAARLAAVKPDLVEWRVDFFHGVSDIGKVSAMLGMISNLLQDIPLLFTFRSKEEGGERFLSNEDYISLNTAVIESGKIDLIDVELFKGREVLDRLIEKAHHHQTPVIVSNHDFQKTPPEEEIVRRLEMAWEAGGDIPKIAVMPQSSLDVLSLLKATCMMKELHPEIPIITMSMAGKGVISRIGGEIFGSAVTFGAVERASAPGQLPAEKLRDVLSLIHDVQ